jgi:hypothetical protein
MSLTMPESAVQPRPPVEPGVPYARVIAGGAASAIMGGALMTLAMWTGLRYGDGAVVWSVLPLVTALVSTVGGLTALQIIVGDRDRL